MVSPLLLHTILWPLCLGAVLAFGFLSVGRRDELLGLVAAGMILAIYLMLEGFPAIPPVAAKQKLGLVLAGIAFVVVFAPRFHLNAGAVTIAVLGMALAWLGWNKLFTTAAWPQSVALLAPIAASAFAVRGLESRASETFLWPLALLVFAIGGSLLSLLGIFVGFAQAMGAVAAWLGGFLTVQYMLVLFGREVNALPSTVLRVILLSFVSISFVVALFAPDISLIGFAVLSLTLVVPQMAPEFHGLSPRIKPFMFGLLLLVPASAAVLVALWQRGMSASL